jgi:hypothetical protein
MKKQVKKLALSKETVRLLERQALVTVAGGLTDHLNTYCCVSSGPPQPNPGFCTGAASCTC